ncbi:glycosyltransferase [Budvicia aquatica]|uniref:GDP-mannose-dependent alpha-(1-6)-phosphatidylinositol dimannoside mannosyltransferase n=1 Tax=Budvicia aquatica TaxID=82979 RepID=A0A2C6BV68_9GAMM|nr:glycosyltransferase [Budvicia aquatica]PHI28050.1 lipopolysaccharide biosynthesis protein [Budvicia aquatica]VFS45818.1 GDP-mannose-dependent alpha-(1-6)-phosphatidylinositol dimannoside mannosyltransferase [Budvicia aquatica]
MKTLHVINLGKLGGVERLFLEYINGENAKNDQILCIGDHIGEEIFSQLKNKNIRFANRICSTLKIKYPSFIRKYVLKRKIEQANADLVIVWDLVLSLPAKPSKGKIVYYDHGCSWRYKHNKKTLQFFAMLDGCLAASIASKRVMQLRFNLPCDIYVIANRIVVPQNIDHSPRNIGHQIRLGTASRLVGLKGISVSILTIKELVERGVDISLVIAGKGPDQEHLEELVNKLNLQNHVKFLGFQSDLSDFFNNIDIYMSTPITEPFGLSCMEALYYGVPVIFPMIDGQPEVILDKYCGIGLIPKVTPEEHYADTGINVDFPHEIYDPINDCLSEALVLSHIECADAIENIINNHYKEYRKNAFNYVDESFQHNKFKDELRTALITINQKKEKRKQI